MIDCIALHTWSTAETSSAVRRKKWAACQRKKNIIAIVNIKQANQPVPCQYTTNWLSWKAHVIFLPIDWTFLVSCRRYDLISTRKPLHAYFVVPGKIWLPLKYLWRSCAYFFFLSQNRILQVVRRSRKKKLLKVLHH